jgi:hypothetical protein
MTVKELITILSVFPEDMEVMDYGYNEITNVKEATWEDTNYPYNKPDKQICLIE